MLQSYFLILQSVHSTLIFYNYRMYFKNYDILTTLMCPDSWFYYGFRSFFFIFLNKQNTF